MDKKTAILVGGTGTGKTHTAIAIAYSGEFFRTVFSQKIDVKLSKILSILTLPKYTSAGVL
ncbi:hypothetical protein [Francisella halioticida]|uniref:hypothetical protein n=1 Tax=Francisella halioticida TaxID=549298 RepID=UPI001BB401D3|nr:hypothetical protein [Francisella halioticida]